MAMGRTTTAGASLHCPLGARTNPPRAGCYETASCVTERHIGVTRIPTNATSPCNDVIRRADRHDHRPKSAEVV